jgi:hypothetical protein
MTINEVIGAMYQDDREPELACDLDGETGEISHRMDAMIQKLDEVLK